MTRLPRRPRTRLAAAVLLSLAGLAILAALAASPASVSPRAQAVAITVGFLGLAVGFGAYSSRTGAAAGLSLASLVFGGLSAYVAVRDLAGVQSMRVAQFEPLEQLGIIRSPPARLDAATLAAFAEATRLTVLAGLTAVLVAAAVQWALTRRRRPHGADMDLVALQRVGHALVAIGFLAVAIALVRFAFVGVTQSSPFAAMKSFWQNGSYFLLVASAALPGFGLLLSTLVARRAPRRDFVALGAQAAVFILALVPAGQRTFLFEAGAIAMWVLWSYRVIRPRTLAIVLVGAVAILVLTQAIRNDIRERGTTSVGSVVGRLAPAQLPNLLGGQVTGFLWTVDIERQRRALRFHDEALSLLEKPVPRGLLAAKAPGFSEQFTRQWAPDAAAEGVFFATPLVIETAATAGKGGMIAIHALLGAALALLAAFALRAGALIRPVVLVAIAWTGIVFTRGDAGNAAFAASGLVAPTFAALAWLRLRGRRRVTRIVVDALQVSTRFAGAGRTVQDIGRSLTRGKPDLPIVLRCGADVAELLAPHFPEGTELHTPVSRSTPRLRRLAYQQLLAPLRDGGSTLLVCPADQGPVWGRARVALAIHDVRRLTHPETVDSPTERLLYRLLQPAAMRHADVIFTGSAFSEGEILRVVAPTAPVVLVAYGPEPRSEPAAGDGHYLLAVTALRRYKGVGDAIEALARTEGVRLIVAGTGAESAALRDRAQELGLAERVEFAGWVSDDRLEELYEHARATVLGSHYEGYGLPVAESLARGVPTIASAIPSHVEIAGDAAVWFTAGDIEGLAAAIETVSCDPDLRARLAREGLVRAAEIAARGPSWAQAIAVAANRGIAAAPAAPPQPALATSR